MKKPTTLEEYKKAYAKWLKTSYGIIEIEKYDDGTHDHENCLYYFSESACKFDEVAGLSIEDVNDLTNDDPAIMFATFLDNVKYVYVPLHGDYHGSDDNCYDRNKPFKAVKTK